MELIKLKNGTEEAKSLIAAVEMSTNRLLSDGFPYPMAFWELVRACKDVTYEPNHLITIELVLLGLMERDGRVHESVKNIVLSSVEGEGLDMKLVPPVAYKP